MEMRKRWSWWNVGCDSEHFGRRRACDCWLSSSRYSSSSSSSGRTKRCSVRLTRHGTPLFVGPFRLGQYSLVVSDWWISRSFARFLSVADRLFSVDVGDCACVCHFMRCDELTKASLRSVCLSPEVMEKLRAFFSPFLSFSFTTLFLFSFTLSFPVRCLFPLFFPIFSFSLFSTRKLS